MTTSREALLVCWLIATCASGARAQEATTVAAVPVAPSAEADSPGRWEYLVEPYFLAPTITGTSGVRGLTADVDASSGDIFGALDFGAMLYLEAHNSAWAISLDGTYMNLGASATSRLGNLDIDLEQTGIMLAGYRRVLEWAEVMAGLQFNDIEASLASTGPAAVNLAGDRNWVDPYVGFRATWLRDKWRFAFFGAVGGFGVGSDFAWQVFPQIGYRFGSLFELTGGFRAITMDYEDGSGNEKFVYDLTTYGPQLGARFHF
jgi:hypothetical protein